jgi:hypothetical protein
LSGFVDVSYFVSNPDFGESTTKILGPVKLGFDDHFPGFIDIAPLAALFYICKPTAKGNI